MNRPYQRVALCLVVCTFAQASRAAVETRLYGACRRYTMALSKALPGGRTLELNLGLQDGLVVQAWGEISGVRSCIDVVDTSALRARGTRLEGRLRCWVQFPGESTTYVGTYDMNADVRDGRLAGSYTGWFGVKGRALVYSTDKLVVAPNQVRYFVSGETIAGELHGNARSHARGVVTTKANLYVGSVLAAGPTDRFRRAWLGLTLKDGKFVSGTIRPYAGQEARWTGKVKAANLRISDGRLSGTVTAEITSRTVTSGTYTFTLDSEVVGNSVHGQIFSRLGTTAVNKGGFTGELSSSLKLSSIEDAAIEMTMVSAVEGSSDLRVHLDRRAGRFVGGAAVWVLGGRPRTGHQVVDTSVIRLEGGRLKGDLKITLTPPAVTSSKPLDVTYAIDVQVDGFNVAGTFKAQFGRRNDVRGAIGGAVHLQDDLGQTHAIRKGHDWPFWTGPIGSFAARPGGHTLVEDLTRARLIWKSEHTPPSRCQTTRYGEGNVHRWIERGGATGGGCSPIVADGKVFLYTFAPHGKDYDRKFVKTQTDKGIHVIDRMWVSRADDTVLCMDAATGQTLWKTTFRGEGLYFGHHGTGQSKGAYTSNLAAADGRLYACPTNTKTYCLDATTGKVLWESKVNTGSVRMVADGVLVGAGHDLVGLDGATGRELWRLKRAGSRSAQPLRWTVGKSEYIIAGNRAGQIVCVEPKTGVVCWTLENTGTQTYSLLTDGAYLLANGTVSEKGKRDVLACYRITPKSAERMWVLKDWPYDPYHHMATMHGGYAWLRTERTKNSERLLCIELSSGRVIRNIDADCSGSSGYTWWMDGRIFIQRDASHSQTPLRLYNAAPKTLRILGPTWETLHRTTTSYYPTLITHAFVDGRVFIRGQRGVFCYDLRRK